MLPLKIRDLMQEVDNLRLKPDGTLDPNHPHVKVFEIPWTP